ncbi:MAG: hypothetical protein WBB23_08725 [Desulforhopalus sp.]
MKDIKNLNVYGLLILLVLQTIITSSCFAQGLVYDDSSRNPVMIPPSERDLQTV